MTPDDTRLLEAHLADGGLDFHLTSASTLAEGLEVIRERTFDVILLDLGLPDSQGIETVERCASAVGGDAPIIVLTGTSDTEAAVRAVRSGAEEFLVKDELTDRTVSRTLQLVLARRQARRLRTSEQEHRLLFQENPLPMFIYDPQSRLIEAANDPMLKQYGYSRDEPIGLPIDELWATDRSDDVEAFVEDAEEGGPWPHERKDGG